MLGLVYTVFGGYVIGWFILAGDRLFTRRMDLAFSFLIIVFLSFALQTILQKFKLKKIYLKLIALFFVIIFSWFATFSYASGPDMRVVSTSEYGVAENVVDNLNNFDKNRDSKIRRLEDYSNLSIFQSSNSKYCVLADTYVLLALEAESSGKIIGGGFPIDYQFGQKDRVELLNKFTNNPEPEDLTKMKELTNTEVCVFVQRSELFTEENLDKVNEIFEQKPELVDGFFVWDESLKKELK